MATTNYLFQTNTLSAAGSAEVLGRGSNDYTTKWSYTTGLDIFNVTNRKWSNFENFPTAVRTGNFVWVLYEIAGGRRAAWILADIVPDPTVDQQFGNNIAYPEIPNHVKYQFDFTSSNAAAYKASADAINTSTYDISIDGTPRYAFTLTGHKTTTKAVAIIAHCSLLVAHRNFPSPDIPCRLPVAHPHCQSHSSPFL